MVFLCSFSVSYCITWVSFASAVYPVAVMQSPVSVLSVLCQSWRCFCLKGVVSGCSGSSHTVFCGSIGCEVVLNSIIINLIWLYEWNAGHEWNSKQTGKLAAILAAILNLGHYADINTEALIQKSILSYQSVFIENNLIVEEETWLPLKLHIIMKTSYPTHFINRVEHKIVTHI